MNAQEAMNPTIEEAIRRLEGMVFTCDLSPETLREIAVNKMCLAALRAEEEREKGCEWCADNYDHRHKTMFRKGSDWNYEAKYCDMCGKRLEVEPWPRNPPYTYMSFLSGPGTWKRSFCGHATRGP